VRQIKLTHISFWAHVKLTSRIVSYRAILLRWRTQKKISAFGPWWLLYRLKPRRHSWPICLVYICFSKSWSYLGWYFRLRPNFSVPSRFCILTRSQTKLSVSGESFRVWSQRKNKVTHCLKNILVLKLSFLTVLFNEWVPSVLWRCCLGGMKGIRLVKNWVVGCWCGYLSGVRCRLAYGPADATVTHCLLLQ